MVDDVTIAEMLALLKDKTVFFDFDGVLAPYQVTDSRVNIDSVEHLRRCADPELDYQSLFRMPSRRMRDLVRILGPEDTYVLTAVQSNFEYVHKINYIQNWYPTIDLNHIFFVADSKFKAPLIEQIWLNTSSSTHRSLRGMVLIEDTMSVIDQCEAMYITCYHVPRLL